MSETQEIRFVERDRMWEVTLVAADGTLSKSAPFRASGHERFSKLEQVLGHVRDLGFKAIDPPYGQNNRRQYAIAVAPSE